MPFVNSELEQVYKSALYQKAYLSGSLTVPDLKCGKGNWKEKEIIHKTLGFGNLRCTVIPTLKRNSRELLHFKEMFVSPLLPKTATVLLKQHDKIKAPAHKEYIWNK